MGRKVNQMWIKVDETGTKAASSARRNTQVIGDSTAQFLKFAGAFAAFGVARGGVGFVSTMEQNQVAFTQFLGTAKAANAEIAALQSLSNEIPAFSFNDYATNAKKLLAM